MVVVIYITKAITTKPLLHGIQTGSPLVVTLGQQYDVGEKPTAILYTYINHHAQPPIMVSFFSEYFYPSTFFSLYGEYVRFPLLPDGVFLPGDHGLYF